MNINMLRPAMILALVTATGACERAKTPNIAVEDLMEDRVTLDGVLMKCNRYPREPNLGPECHNARIAIERLAAERDRTGSAKKEADFERHRERMRAEQDRIRRDREEAQKVDPYQMPLVPPEAPAPGPVAQAGKP